MVDSRLASLATRPPTPPRERNQDPAKLPHDTDRFVHDLLLDTPEESPSSSAEYFAGSSEKLSKKVGFSPWTKYHKPLANCSQNFGWENQIRVLPPSRDCKSSKSILKPSIERDYSASMGELPALDQNSSLSVMLESAMRHLASHSRNSRIDAYTALLGCLSTYDDVPDVHELKEKLPDLIRFFRRDMLATNEETGAFDMHLVAQAVKLLTFFLAAPRISEFLPDDFCVFVLDQSIASLEGQRVPKIVITHYMLLLAKQRFSPKHTSADRMNKLLTALHGVGNIVKGNRVVGQRLMIYRRLLTQAKPLMIARVGDWIDHLITGMLSTIKEIRSWALYFGLEASLSLGATKSVSQAYMDMFNRVSPDGKKVVDCLASRLTEMASSKDDGVHVPQIWAIVILFLRSRRNQLESWEHLKLWLLIIQKCFNSSDSQMKFQANIAWNRLIFVVNLNPSTSAAMIKMLRQPIASQLDRKANQRSSKNAKRVARSSYCTLLYYAFRPSTTHAQLDHYWEEYISQMPPCDRGISSPDVDHTCEILVALFSSSQPKVWDENRANVNDPVRPHELPCIDPKWVRSRCSMILKVFEYLFSVADWQPRKDQEAPIVLAWRSLTSALGEASNKEVKVSMETMTAVAHLVNTIKRFWHQGLKQQDAAKEKDVSILIDRFELLIQEAVAKIGTIPFTERRLTQSSQDSFEAAETPSSRSIRPQGPLSSPVSSLLALLVSSVVDNRVSDNYMPAVDRLVQLALRSATSRRTQLTVLRDLLYPIWLEGSTVSKAKFLLWQLIAKAAGSALRSTKIQEKHGDSPQHVGHEYRDAAKILEVAIRQHVMEAVTEWQDLGTNLAHEISEEIGPEAVTLIIIEPLAAAIHQSNTPGCYDFYLASTVFLLRNTRWPQSRQSMERARKVLWGVGSAPQKQASLDPFDHVYSMTNAMLNTAYFQLRPTAPAAMMDFVSAITSFISSSPVSLKGMLLKQIQQGLAIWIEDAEGLLHNSGSAYNSTSLYHSIMNLWETIAITIEALPKIDSQLLSSIETLIASSLKSRQRVIVNESIQMWNRTFGTVDGLEYPDALRPVLLNLRTLTNLLLPNFPEGIDSDVYASNSLQPFEQCIDASKIDFSPLKFVETQIDEEQLPRNKNNTSKLSSREASALGSSNIMVGQAKGGDILKPSMSEPSPKTTPKARTRPRRDDSQMQFAAIESSPLTSEANDSELLTDHQKEVRERQELEAEVMFPDIRSTPRPRIREQGDIKPRLILRGTQASRTEIDAVDSCPILPAADDISDDVFESSPTPRSSIRRNSNRQSFSGRAPSSTPIKPHMEPGSSHNDSTLIFGESANHGVEAEGNANESASELQIRVETERMNALGGYLPLQSDAHRETSFAPDAWIFPAQSLDHDMSDADPPSDLDVFIDAPSDPLPTTETNVQEQRTECPASQAHSRDVSEPSDNIISEDMVQEPVTPYPPGSLPKGNPSSRTTPKDNEVSKIMDSFQESETSHILSDEDQIAAQLASDLERASSKTKAEISRFSLPVKEEVGEASRKRKGSTRNSGRPAKKLKALPQRPAIQVVVESRRPDDDYMSVEEFKPRRSQKDKQPPSRLPSKTTRASIRKSNSRIDLIRHGRDLTVSDSSRSVSEESHLLLREEKSSLDDAARRASGGTSQSLPELTKTMREHPSHSRSHNICDSATQPCQGSKDVGDAVSPSKTTTGLHPNEDQLLPVSNDLGVEAVQQVQPEAMQQVGTDAPREERSVAQGILAGFKRLLGNIRQIKLGAEEEREMIGVLFESVSEVHAAGRRSTAG